jgi:uncharacterized membrane protein YqjE
MAATMPADSTADTRDTAAASAAAASAGTQAESLTEAASTAWTDLRASLQDRVKLFSLETQRTGLTLVQLVLYAVMAAVLAVTAWLALVGGIGAWLVLHAGMHWAAALAMLVVLNLVAAGLLAWSMRGLVHHLGFPATIRQLQPLAQRSRAP